MKNLYQLLFYLFLLCTAACDKEDDLAIMPTPRPTPTPNPNPNPPTYDNASPVVTIFEPIQDDSYLAIGKIWIYAQATDDVNVDTMSLFLIDPAGARKSIDLQPTGVNEPNRLKTISQFLVHDITTSGKYSIMVEAKDRTGKISSKSVSINIIAEPLSKLDYKKAFMATGWYESMGCCSLGWDVNTFNYGMYSIINKYSWDYYLEPSLIQEFGLDFVGNSQLWSKWDTNKNEDLEYSELEQGLNELGFFERWDKNQDELLTEEEIADGVGILWDVNKDNVVSANEFERKLIRYFLT
ncbi:hypothetical protein WG947_02945 [Pontibacter sp. H259]|uniref:hypothetical protein n=1 Tax=Pontibacter sp. H259 TaxID=3133421 RepID=UPI0030BC2932